MLAPALFDQLTIDIVDKIKPELTCFALSCFILFSSSGARVLSAGPQIRRVSEGIFKQIYFISTFFNQKA
jgi:hypothetical protein